MLKFLLIENFALIDYLEIEFQKGFNLITGETGSGKSILVDAVGLLVGERASQEMVREGFEKARVEGIFKVSSKHPIHKALEETNTPLEDEELIICREISLSGSNKIFVNGKMITQKLLSELGLLLADIHGQHDQQLLLHPKYQLDFLDAFGENQNLVAHLGSLFHKLQTVRSGLNSLNINEKDRLQKLDNLNYQITEIDNLNLRSGLDRELEEERRLLNSSEHRLQASQQAYQLLYEQEISLSNLLNQAEKHIEKLANTDTAYKKTAEKMKDIRFQIEEISHNLRDYADSIEFNPARLDILEEQLLEINKAKRKYGETVEDILEYASRTKEEIIELTENNTKTEELVVLQKKLEAEYLQLARNLSNKRHQDIKNLSKSIGQELANLNLENTIFEVDLNSTEEEISEKGIDQAEFLLSPNIGESPKPLSRIASGGELSRIILALKSIVSPENYLKTLVFDEVDTGIGGRVASTVGEKLSLLSNQHQVFCVTHLPQIACWASHHLHVNKQQSNERTIIQITTLTGKNQIEELARMMAGENVTETSRKQARELLQRSETTTKQVRIDA